MALAMAQRPRRAAFFALMGNPDIPMTGDLLDREFDDTSSRLTGETLDWHQTRHWPAKATD